MNEWRSLPPDDQLTYLVGRIVRSAVDLDAMTRTVWPAIMNLPAASAWEAPLSMTPRLDKLRDALPSVGILRHDELESAQSSLEMARSTYERRNRFIHDDLMPEEGSDVATWSAARMDRRNGSVQQPQVRVNLEDAVKCERDLVRAVWRLWGLHRLIAGVQAGRADHEKNRWRVLMRGDFKLHDGDDSISFSH